MSEFASHGVDVAIVGGGIGGGALATALARAGQKVLVLERDAAPVDRVRGEYMVPWGVAETQRLGLYDRLVAAGANVTSRQVPYGDDIPPDVAERVGSDFSALLPGVPGSLNIGHPRMCALFTQAAEEAGATVLRGVRRLELTTGWPPALAFEHDGRRHELKPRLVVGADGRGSQIARQAGIELEADPATHLLGGLLVEGVPEWPAGVHALGKAGMRRHFVFPQGEGRLRLYLSSPLGNRRDIAGEDGVADFLRRFDSPGIPAGPAIARATPAGPLQFYPNADTWADRPLAPGVVLIGDAAGNNDPSIGQGLSIALRDARLLAEALTASADWSEASFAGYAAERRERLRRLRIVGRVFVSVFVDMSKEATARRQRIFARMGEDPDFAPMFAAPAIGPEALPPEAFDEAAVAGILQA